ncbi:MAG: molybdate transporter, periplasmic molybdate-binding protein [Pseudomonadota bacterium]|jgi:molybdate transport system substrate-binding protein
MSSRPFLRASGGYGYLAYLMGLLIFLTTLNSQAAEITVSAAASLSNAFKEIGQAYEAQHPGDKVRLNFGASGALLQQMAKGAPVDVFASADQETMDQAQKQALTIAKSRVDFVRNKLVMIVPNDSKLSFKGLADLAQPAVQRIAIGNPASVPVGRYTRQALEAAQLWSLAEARMISATNVRQALDYVARGEVDAGFVYATDAALMKDKVRVALDVPLESVIRYPIAILQASPHAAEAGRFIAIVLSAQGQAILGKYGFQKP